MEAIVPRDFDNPSPDAVLSLVSFGTWCSLILTGQSAQETYTYFRRYPKDGYDLKALIGALSLVNALHASFMIHVNSHADIKLGVLQQLWSFWVLEATACIIILVSHFFFARRVYKLGLRTLPFVPFVGIMLLAGLVFTCAFTIYVFLKGTEANKPTAINMISILGISLLLDVVITFRIVNYLRKSRTGLRRTDNILNKLTLFAVNTGNPFEPES
ncbi:hypothetical protein LXA43DRAFT_533233 [Ganoderma leucocontextum]|nr:hypothetical protein LXA43DRAFT_533233 [Ganoderma leucocontextum]